MKPPVISIVGTSRSAKTTLIVRLLPVLLDMGIKLGTIKHDAHRFDIDHEGKDTYRHFQAGSMTVVIASAEKMAMVKRLDGPPALDDLVDKYYDDMELVLTEGYKSGDKAKIEVYRREVAEELLCGPGDNLQAIVTDDPVEADCPVFTWDDLAGLAQFIKDKWL